MITERPIEASDGAPLAASIAHDEYHKDATVEFFVAPGTECNVYSDESGIILFARCSKALRIDIQFVSNSDKKRNFRAMLGGFSALAVKARENGFSEVIFQTDNPELKKFCIRTFGFFESNGEMRKIL